MLTTKARVGSGREVLLQVIAEQFSFVTAGGVGQRCVAAPASAELLDTDCAEEGVGKGRVKGDFAIHNDIWMTLEAGNPCVKTHVCWRDRCRVSTGNARTGRTRPGMRCWRGARRRWARRASRPFGCRLRARLSLPRHAHALTEQGKRFAAKCLLPEQPYTGVVVMDV